MNDFQLSEHFGFHELTITSNADLQDQNRDEAAPFIPAAQALADLLERLRNGRPLRIHSSFRCPQLNMATPGSAVISQHMKFEAADLDRPGQAVADTVAEFLGTLKALKIPFGQLIDETAQRPFAIARWIHVSLGTPWRDPARCGEVLRMIAGPDGKPHYEMIEKVSL